MRALWLVRDNLTTHTGGDTTQILQTRDALVGMGVAVDFASALPVSLDGYDVVHLFHLDRLWEHLAFCRTLRRLRTPAVMSTIYWPADEFDRRARAGFQGTLARMIGGDNYQTTRLIQRYALEVLRHGRLGRWDRRLLNFRSAVRRLLDTVQVILPNSAAERDVIEERFGRCPPAVVVTNAVNGDEFAGEAAPDHVRSGVLCVGRIEPRKNQLALIKALKGTGVELTLVGAAGRFNRKYEARCREAADENVRFLGQQAPRELARLYRGARVHACVSWYETPGLASLEAALCGCNLVVTPGGSTREYFGDDAWYGDANAPDSIRKAVEAALSAPSQSALTQHVKNEYNWRRAAEATLRGYEKALELSGNLARES